MGQNVEIPDEYYETFADRAPDKGLDSADEYINYVLKQVYEKLQRQEQDSEDETTYTEEEEQKVKDRLKGLGYLD
jgi:uncharacterized Ntn-hydrolase superfamily protein